MNGSEDKEKQISLPRILIAGACRGAGVSTIVLGLIVAYRRRTVGVGTAKFGGSLAETTHHRRVMSRLSYTIDPWMLDERQFLHSLHRLSGGTELAIVEGTDGIFDLLEEDCAYPSQADFARALGIPIVLVVDASGYGESIAAAVHGFSRYRNEVRIAGVIANRIENAAHGERIRSAVQGLGGPRYLGGISLGDPHQTGGTLAGLHLYNPSALTRNRVIGTGNLVEGGVDLDALRDIARRAEPLTLDFDTSIATQRLCKIAVADDQAFHLTIQDNLDLVRRMGGELVAFSPIADRKIPSGVAGIYLPGGYVHLYASDLSSNRAMLKSIRDFVASGGVIYAEASALAYLSRRITLFNGSTFEMAGVIPAAATALIDDAERPEMTYQTLYTRRESILGHAGLECRAIKDNRWTLRLEETVESAFEAVDRFNTEDGGVKVLDGFMPSTNVLGVRTSLHWGSCPEMAKRFVKTAASRQPSSD